MSHRTLRACCGTEKAWEYYEIQRAFRLLRCGGRGQGTTAAAMDLLVMASNPAMVRQIAKTALAIDPLAARDAGGGAPCRANIDLHRLAQAVSRRIGVPCSTLRLPSLPASRLP